MHTNRKFWPHYLVPVFLLIVMQRFPCHAKEYHIDSQRQFDALSRATFLPGDIVLFKKGQHFSGMFAPSGSGTEEAVIKDAGIPIVADGGKDLFGTKIRMGRTPLGAVQRSP